jgi:plasmid stabilization system protein ParE
MAKIIWTETAINDINSIAEYISLDSEFYAKQFVQKIFAAADKLEKFPQIGKTVPELLGYD